MEVRNYVGNIGGFRRLTIVTQESNIGLSRSIITGVSAVCGIHGQAIVVEDDIVTSPHFLRYMNDALRRYEDDGRVVSVHGYVYPGIQDLPEAFFLRGADCWGWATWQRGWRLFDSDGSRLLDEIKRRHLARQFDLDGSYPYTRMLESQVAGRLDSWAIRWYASAFLRGKLTLYPGRSLVTNIGTDGTGTHCRKTSRFDAALAQAPVSVWPQRVEEDVRARALIASHLRGLGRPSPPEALRRLFSASSENV
jgi:hypothetical protein